jgi:hypothetical protein
LVRLARGGARAEAPRMASLLVRLEGGGLSSVDDWLND